MTANFYFVYNDEFRPNWNNTKLPMDLEGNEEFHRKSFESILRVYFVNLFRFSVLSFQFALLNWHSCVFEILLKSWILQFLCAYVCKDSLHNYFGILVKMKWQQFLIVTSSLENRSYWLYESTISNGSCANRKLSFFWKISKI